MLIMALNRRTVIVGIGTLLAGGTVIAGSGAFSGNTQRNVTVEFADDSEAYLGFSPAGNGGENDFVTENDGVIGISIPNLNANARTVFSDLIAFTNNSPRAITDMTVSIDDLSRRAEVSVTGLPDSIPAGETKRGFDLVVDTREYAGQPKVNATIGIRTVLAPKEES